MKTIIKMELVSFLKNPLTQKEINLRSSYSHIILFIVVISIILTTSCSITKNLPASDTVYMGTDITIDDIEEAKSIREFKLILNEIPQAGTDNGIGNTKVGLYNLFETTPEKGFKYFIKNKLGSKPIIFKANLIDITEAKLEYYLKGKGFFSNHVDCDTTSTKSKTKLLCAVSLGPRYQIDSLSFPLDSVYLTLDLDEKSKRLVLKENDYYDRDRLEYERLRITSLAGKKGYADFTSNNVHFYVDTTKMDNTVDVYTQIISPMDSTRHIRYILDSILIYPNYSTRRQSLNPVKSIDVGNSITVVETDKYLNYSLFERMILEEADGYYNRSSQYRTTSRLQNLGLFQAINLTNEQSLSGKKDHITQRIYLTPVELQSVSGEFELNNRSGNTFGIGAAITYQNKNLLGNAENLNISIGGQVETQFGDGISLLNSADFNTKAELTIPRIIFPFLRIKGNKNYVPRTVIKTDYTIQRRTELYNIESFTFKYGYRWRESYTKLHELYPININQISVKNQTEKFLELINEDIRLQRSFTNVLIGGLQYYFTYTSKNNKKSRSGSYIGVSVETSGNLMSLILGADQANPIKIAGLKYSQFGKVGVDMRKYWTFGESKIATRFILGLGRAYGNSQDLPYIKQYFVGGSNSIRAFRIRGLGPGAFYTDPDNLTEVESQFLDQTGDMKLEMNVEYRFPIVKFFKSAVFVDAGNVWLIDNPDSSAENFEFSEFYQQIAIGAGLGLRLDFGFFLIRMDIAFPLRAPSIDGFTWTFSDFDPISPSWRQDNLRYNLGIGYPF